MVTSSWGSLCGDTKMGSVCGDIKMGSVSGDTKMGFSIWMTPRWGSLCCVLVSYTERSEYRS